MAKEKKFNPVAVERKAQKAKDIKKGKADVQARRNEKLVQRNPNRLKEQIATLKAIVESGGQLTKIEEQSLESLERDLKAVEKARKALGDKAPTFGRGGAGGGVLGKRRRDNEDVSSDDSDVEEDVKRIPMPRDTPPPIPKPILDEWWAKRRAKRNKEQEQRDGERAGGGGGSNALPLGKDRGIGEGERGEKSATPTMVTEPKVVYEAKPIVRDLRKEAVSAFVPTAVRMKMQKTKGVGGLMEPEEADRLEREGYLKTAPGSEETGDAQRRTVTMEDADDDED